MTGRWQGSNRKSRLPDDWPKRRKAVLRRDRGICHVCGKPGADQADHLVAGDDHRLENLAAIHRWPCHARKSSAEGNAAQAKPPRTRPTERHPGAVQ